MKKFILAYLLLLISINSLGYAENSHHKPKFILPYSEYSDHHQIQTRFGLAYINKDHSLVIKNIPVKPSATGNNFLLVDKIAQTKDADYLLLSDGGGSGCPASYSIVKVTKFKATPTAFFGNCIDLVHDTLKVIPDKSIIASFPEHTMISTGVKLLATTIVYDIQTGTLKENGKPLDSSCKNNACEGY